MSNSNMAANDYPAYLIPYIDFDRLSNQNKPEVRKQQSQKPKIEHKPIERKPVRTQPLKKAPTLIRKTNEQNHSNSLRNFFICLFLILFAVGIFFTLKTNPNKVKITNFFWEKNLVIEKMVRTRREGTKVPKDASIISSKDVMIGYGTDKSGKLKEIHKKVYTYEIDEWVFSRNLTTHGNGKSPNWATSSLKPDERVGEKNEFYMVYVLDYKKNLRNYVIPFDLWSELKKDQVVDISIFEDKEERAIFEQTETGKIIDSAN